MEKYLNKVGGKEVSWNIDFISSPGFKWKDTSHTRAKWMCKLDKNYHHNLFSVSFIFVPFSNTGRIIWKVVIKLMLISTETLCFFICLDG